MSSLSESKSETTVRLEIGKPFGIGMNTTEGKRVLNALKRIQQKLNQNNGSDNENFEKKTKTVSVSASASGDHSFSKRDHKLTNSSNFENNYEKNNESIETRLKLIEKQLENIYILMASNNNNNNNNQNHFPTPSSSPMSANEEHIGFNQRFSDNDLCHKNKPKTNSLTMKSKSFESINKSMPTKHFHLTSKDIPFLLGTTSNSHSVIANRQIEISKLKQHNQLCDRKPSREVFSEKVRNNLLDHEIKELLYDLQEEHNYICEEIQHLTKHLETITEESKRDQFKRELYFLSRRILAKKKQINELQELHSIIIRNSYRKHDLTDIRLENTYRPKVLTKKSVTISNEYLPKWV